MLVMIVIVYMIRIGASIGNDEYIVHRPLVGDIKLGCG
jgi:hypothetical protein